MMLRVSRIGLLIVAVSLLALVSGFTGAISVKAQHEGQTLCGYLGGIYGPGIIIAGTIPPCPTAYEAFTNPIYGGSAQCAYPGNLLPVCSQDKWFWVDNDDGGPEDPTDPEPSPDVTATLTANPETIENGDESLLTWSSTNATSCVGNGFETGGATEGSVPVYPSESTTYIVTCTDGESGGSGGLAWELIEDDSLNDFSCTGPRPDPNDTWAYRGTPTCSSASVEGDPCGEHGSMCKWNRYAAPQQQGNCNILTDLYYCSPSGDSDPTIHSASDSASVTVVDSSLSATCSVAPETIAQGESATWTASASGGNGSYEYLWSGTDGLTGTAVSVTKQYLTPGQKVAQVQVTSDDEVVTVACVNNLTVTGANLPNLQAGNVTHTPSAPAAGDATTLLATVSNVTAYSTLDGFEDQFQINKDFIPLLDSDIDDTVQFDSNAIAGNSSNIASITYSFPSEGRWYVRVCADKTAGGTSPYDILETSETDNCSNDWTAIDVGDGDLSCSFDHDDDDNDGRVDIGEEVHFSASPGNLGSSAYTWDPSDAPADSGEGSTYDYEYDDDGKFSMKVSAQDHGSDICSVKVVPIGCTGAECDCFAQELTLSASPSRVRREDTSTLRYEIPGVEDGITTCTIRSNKDSTFVRTITIDSCDVEESGTVETHPITTQTTFTLTCDDETASALVDVVPEIIEI